MFRSHARLLALLLLAAGCTGSIGGHKQPAGGGIAPGDITGPRTEPLCSTPATPRPVYLRRLTNEEYNHTVSDLLGVTVDAGTRFDFPSDTSAGGFRNNAENGTISTLHVDRYSRAAEQLVTELLQSSTRRIAVVGCDMSTGDRAACLDSFLRNFGRRAYRRPLRADEVSALTTLANTAAADADPWAGVSLAAQAMLQSADFLYRVELGQSDPAYAGAMKLNGFELATRLSYLLWGTTPDNRMLDLAAAGQLDTVEGVRAQAQQMLADARGHKAMQDFYMQWLMIEEIDQVTPNATLFPAWNEDLRAAMREETIRFADDLIWRDGGSLLELLSGRHTFANASLAAFYGIPAPSGGGWARIDLPSGPRGGFLTQASFLAVTSRPTRTSPTIRGRYIREALLCERLPDPPADVNTMLPTTPGLSLRDRLDQHAKDPACSSCHSFMDPVGLAFEQYDAIGAFRTTDTDGTTISAAGNLKGFDPSAFEGPQGLSERLLSTSAFPRCASIHAFRFAFGRRETADDRCTTDSFYVALRDSGYSVPQLLTAMVTSDAFRYRLNGGN